MPKSFMPFSEPLPYYMTAIGMQGARFLEGNTGAAAAGAEGAAGAAAAAGTEGAEGGASGQGAADNGQGADNAELDKAKADLATASAEVQQLTESVSTHETTISQHVATIADRDNEISVLKLAMTNGITSSNDLDLLRGITDETKRKTLAERLAQTAKRSGVVHSSGTGDGGSNSGGSIAEHRRQISERKTK